MALKEHVGIVVIAAVFVWPNAVAAQRLPGSATPSTYELTFRPDLNAATFSGDERIEVAIARPTDAIVLNALELTISSAQIVQGGTAQTATVTFDTDRQQVTLRVPRQLVAGTAQVRLTFAGTLNEQLAGFYLGKTDRRRYAATQLEATDARRAFPCFDEPALKAVFDITLIVDAGDRAISNGRVVSDTPGPMPGKHTVKFASTKLMSTYLVAMLVGDFECLEDAHGSVPLRVCAMGGQHTGGRFALDATKAFLTFYDTYYGIPYPFEKLDQIAIPDFGAGAMENTAAIVYRETALVVDEKSASRDQLEGMANIIAHEIAHQWFGDLVTMDWWNNVWLNEGFATWMASKALAAWKPDWEVGQSEIEETLDAASSDSVASTRPIQAPIANTPTEIAQLFDAISYSKTASVLRMIERYVGADAFRRGVQAYISEHAYGTASGVDFWTTLRRVSGKPVDDVMTSFVQNAGVPLVSLTARCTEGRGQITVEQQRFFTDPVKLAAASAERWSIPVCVKTSTGATACELLTTKSQTLSLPGCPAWTVGNADARGYYVTAYANEDALELARESAALTATERLQLVSDQYSLVQAGRQTLPTYLSIVERLNRNQPYRVLNAVWSDLAFIERELIPDPTRAAYRAWARGLLRDVIGKLGRDVRPGESDEARQVRALALRRMANTAGDVETIQYLTSLATRYLSDPSSVDPSLSDVAINSAARNGNADLYARMLTALESATAPDVRHRLEAALALFPAPELLSRTLRRSLTPAVRAQDLLEVLFTAVPYPATRPLVWSFIKEHFDEIQSRLGSPGGTAIVNLVGYFCDSALRDDARTFFAAHPLAGAETTLAQGFEQAEACIALKTREQERLGRWLTSKSPLR